MLPSEWMNENFPLPTSWSWHSSLIHEFREKEGVEGGSCWRSHDGENINHDACVCVYRYVMHTLLIQMRGEERPSDSPFLMQQLEEKNNHHKKIMWRERGGASSLCVRYARVGDFLGSSQLVVLCLPDHRHDDVVVVVCNAFSFLRRGW